jgi:hypothetical protein
MASTGAKGVPNYVTKCPKMSDLKKHEMSNYNYLKRKTRKRRTFVFGCCPCYAKAHQTLRLNYWNIRISGYSNPESRTTNHESRITNTNPEKTIFRTNKNPETPTITLARASPAAERSEQTLAGRIRRRRMTGYVAKSAYSGLRGGRSVERQRTNSPHVHFLWYTSTGRALLFWMNR